MGVFARMMAGLAFEGTEQKMVMIDATQLKAHRTASSLWAKKGGDQCGRTKGGLYAKLHAVAKGCYRRRNRIEIMFDCLKDWRRVATRYDRCTKTFLSALALAATIMLWL
ncbi:Transposase DDE domain-containing protein [Gemmobacter aquatilis]|uniref:Transposase DDE domain-containing protein n=1 Tax=Gemmobacter aquatilis TaxID=933059 RepID=A0A1H8CK89_9RHOB|nr:Transposase DDE domain-containing protein [Gemmobacter aquatilis]